MAAPSRRPIAPKLGNSFLTRQLSLQSPNPPSTQPSQQHGQQLTQQHRKLAFRRQSSEDLSLRRGRRRGRDTPSPAQSSASDISKCWNPIPSDDKRANTASDRSSDVRWRQDGGQNSVPQTTSASLFNRHFPPSKEQQPQSCTSNSTFPPGPSGPVAGRPITPARPRPVRLAWAEKRSPTVVQAALPTASDPQRALEDSTEEDAPVEVVAKKMGQPKPVTGSVLKAQLVRSHHGLPSMIAEKDSVLQTRQHLADKLRRAWWGEDQLRPNLDIFLTCLANDGNVEGSTPPGEESAPRMKFEDSVIESSEASPDQRESKMISIKIDTVTSQNSSREGENDDLISGGESRVSLNCGSPTEGANGRPKDTAQVPQPSPSKSTFSACSPSSSKGLNSVSVHSTEPKASSEHSPSHESGNEFVCAVEICERIKGSIHSGQGCDDGSSGGLAETAAERSMVASSQTSSTTVPPAESTRASGQVTNGLSAVRGASEIKREAPTAATGKTQAAGGQGNEGKASCAINASSRRAQFRNSSMNRKTLTRSVDSIPSCTAPTGGTSPSGSTTPGVVTTTSSSRVVAGVSTAMASGGGAMDTSGRAKEEAMKSKRGVQQVPEMDKVERNPWKRNAETAGIMRATTVDSGEGPHPLEFGASLPSSSAAPSVAAASSSPFFPSSSQARPSTATTAAAARAAADRAAIRSAASFATAAAAKHRQKTSSKRRSVRRSTEDEEGAEGEGAGEDVCGGVRGPGGGYPRGKGGVRGAHADVVTMVSLVSPTGSDTEEPLPQVFSFPRDPAATAPAVPTPVALSSRAQSARRAGGLTRMLSMDVAPERSNVQRKLHKSVSFQSDLPPDEEDDVFSRRPAFPASLIIPRIPSTSIPNSTASSVPAPPISASPAAAAPPRTPPAPPPVIIPPSLSQQHVPKIVDPSTPRSTYLPPSHASKAAEDRGQGRVVTAGQRPSSAGTALAGTRGSAPDRDEDGGAGDDCHGEKGRSSRKRVMFRSRSASLRGSEEDHTELKEKTGSRSAQTTQAGGIDHSGEGLHARGAASDKSHTTSTSNSVAAGKQQRGLVVTLTERQGGASPKAAADDRARGSGGGGTTTHRPSTAGGNRRSNVGEKGKREEETGDGSGENEGEEAGVQNPEFKSAKEKECWELYRRMCDKGLTVSYDTILRGMLTPTEYRMRRNALLSTG